MKINLNATDVVDNYLSKGDFSSENANNSWSPVGMLTAAGGDCLERDYLKRMKEAGHTEIARMYENGQVHIHDLSFGFHAPYCSGHSMQNLLASGIGTGTIESSPAKHFRTVINHMINFIGEASNEFSGAQAFSDVDLFLSPYALKEYRHYLDVTKDESVALQLALREIRQSIQEFIYHLNYNNRFGAQSPFSNITLAISCPDDLKNSAALIAGKPIDDHTTYGDLDFWQNAINEALIDTFMEGDIKGNGFRFPVLTVNATSDLFTSKIGDKIFDLTARYGTPYFQNFINGHSGGEPIVPEDTRAMCCRLQLNKKEIQKHVGGIFGAAEQTGSLQVCTLSLPYIAEKTKNVDDFFKEVFRTMELIKEEQLWKREMVDKFFKVGMFPVSKRTLGRAFETYFTTIGYIGLWEAVGILLDDEESFSNDEGMKLAKDILQEIMKKCNHFTETTGKLFNLEATPAESASYKLAKKALKIYPDIFCQGTPEAPYFTNSCHIPAQDQGDIDLMLRTQNELQPIHTGGTVVHFYIGEEMSGENVRNTVEFLCKNTEIPYFSLTTVYSICEICGRVSGNHIYCPHEHTPEQIAELKKNRPDLIVEVEE